LPPENELELSRILPIGLAGVLQVDFPDYIEKQGKKSIKNIISSSTESYNKV